MPAAAQSLPGGDWSPGPNALGDSTLAGFIDQPASGATVRAGAPFHVGGWVVDTAAEGWAGIDGVQVLQGDRVLVNGSVAANRPDVGAALGNPFFSASGFDAVVPGNALSAGPATLTIAAHTPGKGTWTRQVNVNVSGSAPAQPTTGLVLQVLQPPDMGNVIGNYNGTIYGVAYDTRTRAELGTGVDRVQVYLDGERGLAGSQYIGDAKLNGTSWSLDWAPTKYNHVQHHILWVYARSNVTGEEKLVQEEINILPN